MGENTSLGGKIRKGKGKKSNTRKNYGSETNSIARKGVKGKISPCRVKEQRPLWGLGQRPNCFSGAQFKENSPQRRRQRSVPASNFARPQTRLQAALSTNRAVSRQMGATGLLVFLHTQGISRLRARPKGFPIALWKPSGCTLPYLTFSGSYEVTKTLFLNQHY